MSNFKVFQDKFRFAVVDEKKPIVWIDSFDYGFIADEVKKLPGDVWEWRSSEGNVYDLKKGQQQPLTNKGEQKYLKLSDVLNLLPQINNISILLAQAYEETFKQDTYLLPALKEFVYKGSFKTIIIVSNQIEIPGLEHICERFALPLPDIEDIDRELGFLNAEISRNDLGEVIGVGDSIEVERVVEKDAEGIYTIKDPRKGLVRRDEQNNVLDIMISNSQYLDYPFLDDFMDIDSKGRDVRQHYQILVESLCGMYLYDIKKLLKSFIAKDEFIRFRHGDKDIDKVIMEGKKQIVRNSGLLEMVDYDNDYWMQVADIDELMHYISEEGKRINNPNNYPPKLPKPKGILLVGAPGCGKSESAKAIASKLDKPLYRLNIGSLLGHKYGQSENKFIEALRTADASAPCVLWIDEIEKAFAGAGNESENDDTLTHIVGHFLTWMQEHKTMVYLVATANDVSKMKPEMLRKGRWDERFYLTYPSTKGCEQIIRAISEKKLNLCVKSKFVCDGKELVEDVFVSEKTIRSNCYSVNKKAEHNLSIITEALRLGNKSGAEIENLIIETIVKYGAQKFEDKWVIYLNDIAQTIINDLQEKERYKSDMIEQKSNNEAEQDPFGRIEAYLTKESAERKKNENNKNVEIDNDPFILMKINKDIQDAKIKMLGKELPDEDKLKILLFEKYKEQYRFKSASSYKNAKI